MTKTLQTLIAGLEAENAGHLHIALEVGAGLAKQGKAPGLALMVLRDLALTLDTHHPVPDRPAATQDASGLLASAHQDELTGLLVTASILGRPGGPWPTAVTAIFEEVKLMTEAARIAGHHVLDREGERKIQAVLDGGVC